MAAILGTPAVCAWVVSEPLIHSSLGPVVVLTIFFWTKPELRSVLGLAWDCGAVTTGPVTVPLVLALGIGIANSAGKGNSLSGFGIVTLASLFPILAVLLLTLFVSDADIAKLLRTAAAAATTTATSIWDQTPLVEIVLGVRAILPLVLFLGAVLYFVIKIKVPNRMVTFYGLTLWIIGMCVFNLGLTYGLGAIGTQTGGALPGAFMELAIVKSSPIFPEIIGIVIVILFAFILGFGATLAEPALNALGLTVQKLTNGAFKEIHADVQRCHRRRRRHRAWDF